MKAVVFLTTASQCNSIDCIPRYAYSQSLIIVSKLNNTRFFGTH